MKTKNIIVSVLLTTILSAFMFYLSSKNEKNLIPNDVYEVYVEGKSIGYITSEEDFLDLVDKKQDTIKTNYGVDKVYPPTGLAIEKVTTYDTNIRSSEEIYNTIENTNPFTIDGYIVTIKYKDEQKEPLIIYTLKEE